MFNPAQTADWKEAVKATLSKRLDWLSKQLEGKQYLMGEKFSVADGYLFTILRWAKNCRFRPRQMARHSAIRHACWPAAEGS
jgi:glutathione S-transferase